MAWSEAKWVVDQLMNKLGTAPNNMRAFTAYAVSKRCQSKAVVLSALPFL